MERNGNSKMIGGQSLPSKEERGLFTGESAERLKIVLLNPSCALGSAEELGNLPVLWPQPRDSGLIDLVWHHGHLTFSEFPQSH